MNVFWKKTFLLSAFSTFALTIHADSDFICDHSTSENFRPCFYMGLGLGASRLSPDMENTGWQTDKKTHVSGNVYVGYHFLPVWFMEAAYADLGKLEVKNKNPLINNTGEIHYTVSNVMAGYYLPLPKAMQNQAFNPFVKFGIASLNTQASSSQIQLEKEHSPQLAWGAGIDWRLANNWKLRNSLELYDEDAYQINLSVSYIFGESPNHNKTASQSSSANAVPDQKTIDDACQKLTASPEEITFKINSSELTPQATSRLLEVADGLQTLTSINIGIYTYTDSEGNQILSRNRAENIKGFLLTRGIDPARISARGWGNQNPVADNATVEGKLKNRRVDIQLENADLCKKEENPK